MMKQELFKILSKEIKANKKKVYFDYNDIIDIDLIAESFKHQDPFNWLENKIYELCGDTIYELEINAISEVANNHIKEICELESIPENYFNSNIWANDNREELLDYLEITLDISEIIPTFNLRFELQSNYDCFNSWYYESLNTFSKESYFYDMITALNLNPAEIFKELKKRNIKILESCWTPKDDTNRLISYKDFWSEIENLSCPASLLTILCKGDINLLKNYNTNYILPKGLRIGMYSDFNGGGSTFEAKTLQSITLNENWKLCVDNGSYSLKEVYGVSNDFFSK